MLPSSKTYHFSQLHTAKYVSSSIQINQTDTGCTQKRVVSLIALPFLTSSPGLDMLICYGCGVTAHKYCYGLKTPTDQFLVSGQKISMFVCEKCQYLGPKCSKVIHLFLEINGWEYSFLHYQCLMRGSNAPFYLICKNLKDLRHFLQDWILNGILFPIFGDIQFLQNKTV